MLICWCIQQFADASSAVRGVGEISCSAKWGACFASDLAAAGTAIQSLQPVHASLTFLCSSCADMPSFFTHLLWASSLTRNQQDLTETSCLAQVFKSPAFPSLQFCSLISGCHALHAFPWLLKLQPARHMEGVL